MGKLYAKGAIISGTIIADYITANTGGYIGGWEITSTQLKSGNIILNSNNGTISSSYGNNSFQISNNGTVFANAGTIGGWEITQDTLQKQSGGLITGFQHPGSGNIAITVGATNNNNWTSGKFYVTHEGKMYAEDAIIKGTVEASEGKFGDWYITKYNDDYDSTKLKESWLTTSPEKQLPDFGIQMGLMYNVRSSQLDSKFIDKLPVINFYGGRLNLRGGYPGGERAALRLMDYAQIDFSGGCVYEEGRMYKPVTIDGGIQIKSSTGEEISVDDKNLMIKNGLICVYIGDV